MSTRKPPLTALKNNSPVAVAANPDQRVTLRDIAKAVGVSPVSVSLALRNSSRVSETVRQKIQQQAQAMGYRPDPMLAALSHYRRANVKSPVSSELAWVNCWPDSKQLRSFKEFDLYWSAAFDEAEKCGYRLEEFDLNKKMSATRLEQILLSRNIQGILLPPRETDHHPDWQNFQWNRFCTIRFGYSFQNPRVHIVSSDQLTNGLIACENISRLGYKRIGWVTREKTVVRFAAGYFYHQMQQNSVGQLLPLRLRESNQAEDQQALAVWIKKFKPDAIFSDCAQLQTLLAKLGLRVPQDIGLATASTLDGNADAGIYQNSAEIGRAAVQLIISLIHHNDFGLPKICREVLIEGSWVDGHTLPDRN